MNSLVVLFIGLFACFTSVHAQCKRAGQNATDASECCRKLEYSCGQCCTKDKCDLIYTDDPCCDDLDQERTCQLGECKKCIELGKDCAFKLNACCDGLKCTLINEPKKIGELQLLRCQQCKAKGEDCHILNGVIGANCCGELECNVKTLKCGPKVIWP